MNDNYKVATGTIVNGNAHDFSSIKLTAYGSAGGVLYERFNEISYEHAVTVSTLRADAGSLPLDEGIGEYTASGTLTMYLDDWRDLRKQLANVDKTKGWMQVSFDLLVQYTPDMYAKPVSDWLRKCRISSVSRSFRRGSEALMVAIRLYIRVVEEDGDKPIMTVDDPVIS